MTPRQYVEVELSTAGKEVLAALIDDMEKRIARLSTALERIRNRLVEDEMIYTVRDGGPTFRCLQIARAALLEK